MVNLVKLAEEAIAAQNMGRDLSFSVDSGSCVYPLSEFKAIADVDVDPKEVSDDLRIYVCSRRHYIDATGIFKREGYFKEGYFKIEKEYGVWNRPTGEIYGSGALGGIPETFCKVKFVYVSQEDIKKQQQEEQKRQEDQVKRDKLIELGVLKTCVAQTSEGLLIEKI